MGDWMSGHKTCPTKTQMMNSGFDPQKLCQECPLLTDFKDYWDKALSCLSYLVCDFATIIKEACSGAGKTISGAGGAGTWPTSQFQATAKSECMDYDWQLNYWMHNVMK